MGASAKEALKEVPVYEAVFFRSLVSVLLSTFLIIQQRVSFIGNRPLLLLGRGLSGFIALVFIFYAIANIPLGDVAILSQTSPLFVVLFSVLFLGEKFSLQIFILTLLSLGGVALVVHPTFHQFNLATWAALASGVLAACAYIAIRQLHATESFLTMVFYFSFISMFFTFPLVIFKGVTPRPFILFLLLFGGLVGTFAQLLLTHAYKLQEASKIAPFAYTAVVFSFLMGVLFFDEIPNKSSIIGSLLIILSCIFLTRSQRKVGIKNSEEVVLEEFDR